MMPCFKRIILLSVATVVALASAPAAGDDDRAALTKPPAGSIAAQLRLKRNLQRITAGSLVASLEHNREAWENLTPDERGRFRKSYLAYHQKDPAEREKLLKSYEKLFKMSPERREAWRRRAKPWTGSGQFYTTGDEWTDDYVSVPYGLMESPVLSVRE